MDAPISYTRYFDSLEELRILNGNPIWLLKFFIVLEEWSSVLAMTLVVVVFPLLPVIAITFPS